MTLRLRALPVHRVELDDGVVLKRGAVEFFIGGVDAARYVRAVFAAVGDRAFAREPLVATFAASDQGAIADLIDQLVERRFIVAAEPVSGDSDETPIDIFAWHFGQQMRDITSRLAQRTIVVVGLTYIGRRIAEALHEIGIDVDVVDIPALRTPAWHDGTARSAAWPATIPVRAHDDLKHANAAGKRCIIATSDAGARAVLRDLNAEALAAGDHFFPVVLHNLVGTVGPYVVPGESACYACALARENANRRVAHDERIDADSAALGRISGFLPSMASILADIAVLEVVKFNCGIPRSEIGTAIDVSLLVPRLTPHRVLRVPRCDACGGRFRHAAPNAEAPLPIDLPAGVG